MLTDKLLLIVEDDSRDASHLQKLAVKNGMKVHVCTSVPDFRNWISGKHRLDYAIVDIHLTNDSSLAGIGLIAELNNLYPDSPILAISSDPSLSENFEVLKAGAALFVKKPLENTKSLEIAVSTAKYVLDLKSGRLGHEKSRQRETTSFRFSLLNEVMSKYPYGIIVEDETVSLIEKVMRKDRNCPFLVLGPSGSGKEQIAKLISLKKEELYGPTPFEAQNCAIFNSDTGASALFGHKRGAFTGADKDRKGAIGNSNGGILFLDEVHTLTLSFQEKLLRFLQDKAYQPLGSDEWLKAEVQFVFASNESFEKLVSTEKFKADLYYRMAAGEVLKLRDINESKELIRDAVALFFAGKGIDITSTDFERIYAQCAKITWNGQFRELHHALDRLERRVEGLNYEKAKVESFSIALPDPTSGGLVDWINGKLQSIGDSGLLAEAKVDLFSFFRDKGMSYEEIARVLGVSKNTVVTIAKETQGK